jgi:hypothetical protein
VLQFAGGFVPFNFQLNREEDLLRLRRGRWPFLPCCPSGKGVRLPFFFFQRLHLFFFAYEEENRTLIIGKNSRSSIQQT